MCTALLVCALHSRAEDSDQFRTYIDWRVGEFAPVWGVLDLRGISYGANFNRNWGGELALDFWQLNLEGPQGEEAIGEMAMWNLMPQLRFRVPLWNDRLVPYAVVGAGAVWSQFNDRTKDGTKYQIGNEEGWTFSVAGGVGVDFFLSSFESNAIWRIRSWGGRHLQASSTCC